MASRFNINPSRVVRGEMAKVKGREHFWFKFDINAYEDSTDHLSALEDGTYNRLIRHYYKTYRPIPLNEQQIIRISRAHSAEEIEAVSRILREFFEQREDGWHNKRCDREILESKKISKLRSNSAHQRWDDNPDAKAYANASPSAPANEQQMHTQLQLQKQEPKVKSVVHFVHPTLEEVTEYCASRGKLVDPQRWIDHYSANGWKVGRNQMKDWRAAVRNWERNGAQNGTNQQHIQTQPRPHVTAQHQRLAGNLLAVGAKYGLRPVRAAAAGAGSAGVGDSGNSNGSGQAPRSTGDHPGFLEGEIKKQ